MSAPNGVNIASFDLSDMSGNANIGISQQTYDVKQTIQNGVRAHGAVAGAALSGVNLGNVLTFAAPEIQLARRLVTTALRSLREPHFFDRPGPGRFFERRQHAYRCVGGDALYNCR